MQYGRKIRQYTDAHGLIYIQTFYIKGGKTMPEERETIEEQKRVNNNLEEAAVYHNFAKQYHQDPTMLNPAIRIEGKGKQDYYYVVTSYTRVIKS